MLLENFRKYIILILSSSLELNIIKLNLVKDNNEDRRKGNWKVIFTHLVTDLLLWLLLAVVVINVEKTGD